MIKLPFTVGVSPTNKIRGIIATQNIKKGTIIEKCPMIFVEMSQEDALKHTILWDYYYEWNKYYHAIVLGYGSLINHSYTPNCKYTRDYKKKLFVVTAIKNIKKGEEITVNYNYFPDCQDPLDNNLVDFNKRIPVLINEDKLLEVPKIMKR